MELNTILERLSRNRLWLGVVAIVVIALAAAFWLNAPSPVMEKPAPVTAEPEVARPEREATQTGTGPSQTDQPVVAPTATSRDPRTAQIRVGSVENEVIPNARGEFPRLLVAAEAEISADVPFPDALPGQHIYVQADDGGLLSGKAADGALIVDESRQVSLEFQTSAWDGLHRVTLRRGGDSRVLQFWVGPEPPVHIRE